MNKEKYISSLNALKKLSGVKLTLLNRLWDNGTFPSNWVPSAELLDLTSQKYFDRRLRELRDEHGCDLETKHINGEHHWRLVSTKLAMGNQRQYLSNTDKTKLFRSENFTCQVCGTRCEPGSRGLQADHKVPLSRNGTHDYSNWQSLCADCNIAKRRACAGCEADCNTCNWAYPTNNGFPITIRLEKDVYDRLDKKLKREPQWLIQLIGKEV